MDRKRFLWDLALISGFGLSFDRIRKQFNIKEDNGISSLIDTPQLSLEKLTNMYGLGLLLGDSEAASIEPLIVALKRSISQKTQEELSEIDENNNNDFYDFVVASTKNKFQQYYLSKGTTGLPKEFILEQKALAIKNALSGYLKHNKKMDLEQITLEEIRNVCNKHMDLSEKEKKSLFLKFKRNYFFNLQDELQIKKELLTRLDYKEDILYLDGFKIELNERQSMFIERYLRKITHLSDLTNDGNKNMQRCAKTLQRLMPYGETIRKATVHFNIDKYYFISIIKEESLGSVYAISSANAISMCQIIESTGKLYYELAKKSKDVYIKKSFLGYAENSILKALSTDQDFNINMSAFIIADLLKNARSRTRLTKHGLVAAEYHNQGREIDEINNEVSKDSLRDIIDYSVITSEYNAGPKKRSMPNIKSRFSNKSITTFLMENKITPINETTAYTLNVLNSWDVMKNMDKLLSDLQSLYNDKGNIEAASFLLGNNLKAI